MAGKPHLLLWLLLFATLPVAAQEEEDDSDPPLLEALSGIRSLNASYKDFTFSDDGSTQRVVLIGNAHVVTTEFELFADELGLVSRLEDGERRNRIYAQGHVLLRRDGDTVRAEQVFFDQKRNLLVFTQARARVALETLEKIQEQFSREGYLARRRQRINLSFSDDRSERWSAPLLRALGRIPPQVLDDRGKLVVAAERLEVEDFDVLRGEGVQVTTCDFGVPHWSITARRAEVTRRGRDAEAKGDQEGEPGSGAGTPNDEAVKEAAEESESSYRARTSGAGIEVGGLKVFAFPRLNWDTRWVKSIPLKSVGYSNSSKFGNRIETVWKGDLLVPRALDRYVDLELRLEYFSKRGLAYGADVEYGVDFRRWAQEPPRVLDVYGTGTYWRIDDRADEDRNGTPIPDDERWRGRWHQKLRLPWKTLVDLEYSESSDENFLLEYFEDELRNEKRPETLAFVRQPLIEDTWATVFANKRTERFQTELERQPEASLQVLEKPVIGSHVYLDVESAASDLELLPAADTGLPSTESGRGDALATLASSLGSSRYGRVRPFFETRYTAWENDINGESEERLTLATGARAGLHLHRTYPLQSRILRIDGLRHTIDPEISYRLLFENNVDPADLFRYDETEDVDKEEVLTLGLRNFIFVRRLEVDPLRDEPAEAAEPDSYGQVKFAELEVEIDYFPDPNRDNLGDKWSDLELDLLFFPLPGVTFFTELDYDVTGSTDVEEINTGARMLSTRGDLVGLVHRYRQDVSESLLGQLRLVASKKYEIGADFEYDLRDSQTINQEYLLTRNFHRWVAQFSIEIDEGENDNVTFMVRVGPRELLEAFRDRESASRN